MKAAVFGLLNRTLLTTVTGNTGARPREPRAVGTAAGKKVPVVPSGGVPMSSALPVPLSCKVSHGAFGSREEAPGYRGRRAGRR